jgi:hypothetical protein
MPTTPEDFLALGLCAAAVIAGVALFLVGVWIDPARRVRNN